MSAATRSSTVRVGRRLAPLYASAFTGGIALWVPVEKLFLDELGFTPAILGVMAALYAAAVPLLEVPSGILADRWSRRGVLVIGNLGALASVAVGGLSTGVAMYLVAAVLLGVYFAMQSGTLDAIVYDAVLEETGSSDTFEAGLPSLHEALPSPDGSSVHGTLNADRFKKLSGPCVPANGSPTMSGRGKNSPVPL